MDSNIHDSNGWTNLTSPAVLRSRERSRLYYANHRAEISVRRKIHRATTTTTSLVHTLQSYSHPSTTTQHAVLTSDIAFTELNNKDRIQNVIRNPHSTTLYLHQHFTIFCEEVIEKLMGVVNYWYRYEWQSRGSAHIHGFIWLKTFL